MRLESEKEIIEILQNVEENDIYCNLQFTCTIEIEPQLSKVSYETLCSVIGKKIDILNLEDEFYIREIEGGCII